MHLGCKRALNWRVVKYNYNFELKNEACDKNLFPILFYSSIIEFKCGAYLRAALIQVNTVTNLIFTQHGYDFFCYFLLNYEFNKEYSSVAIDRIKI